MEGQSSKQRSLMIETISVVGILIILSFVFKQAAPLISVVSIAYLFIERRKRGRTWGEIGFKINSVIGDVKNNWIWIITVGVVVQFLVVFIAKHYIPGFFEHVKSRIPVINISQLLPMLILIIISTFLEEVVYRGFFQERVSWYIRP
jgi:membrane protease YdiL (CAAX protease family)